MVLPFQRYYVPLITVALLLGACGDSTHDQGRESVELDTLATDRKEGELFKVGGELFSIPSPVQAMLAIRKAGIQYNKDLTAPLNAGDALAGKVEQSLMLGLYGADLAYVTVHNDGLRSLATLQAIEKLGSVLGLSNAIDRSLVERFNANLGSEDSLLRFSGVAFRTADQYLKTNDRDDLSALVLAGGWVEAMHLTLADPAVLKDQVLLDRVGEQRRSLNALVALIERTDRDKAATALLAALKELQGYMAAVKSTYSYEEPVTDVAKRTTFINSTSTVTVPDEALVNIRSKVAAIRSMIIA